MKVYFNGFWGGFVEKVDPIDIDFFLKLLSDIYNEDFMVIFNLDEADILVEFIFTNKTKMESILFIYRRIILCPMYAK